MNTYQVQHLHEIQYDAVLSLIRRGNVLYKECSPDFLDYNKGLSV